MDSRVKEKKHLSFNALRKSLSQHINTSTDSRKSSASQYTQHDVVMSGFACMYFQDPSLVQFQQRLETSRGRSNLQTLFNVHQTPKESQMREVLDKYSSESFAPVFKDFHERLRRHHHLKGYEILPNTIMCVIDGTQHYSSKSISCKCCLHKTHKNGDKTYYHSVLQGAIMHPDKRQVLPVMPEAIKNGDGKEKQDCEINAAKRFVNRLYKAHPRQKSILGGDSLMSRQPLIEDVLNKNMHYLFVAKPTDHVYMYDWLEAFPELLTTEYVDKKEKTHRFYWQNDVPLNGGANAIKVNYLEYQQIDESGKVTFKNSWVTDIEITDENIIKLAKAGRCRWKIENECFNTLKNQGYNIKHNYGHGKENLSFNVYLLILLAFYFHQIFELTDTAYQACRKRNGSKQHMWEQLRSIIKIVIFKTWEELLALVTDPDAFDIPIKKS